MKKTQKVYAPVTDFERATSYCPLYLAWRILDEARNYFRTSIPEKYADKLALRAEVVYAKHPFWQRRFKSRRGRDAILTSMRHWLAGVLAREQPALFRDLPDSFKVGALLPLQPLARAKRSRKRNTAAKQFNHAVHGCELLTV